MSEIIDTVFLDMDGVLCQWWEAAVRLCERRLPDRGTLTRPVSYYAHEHMAMERAELDMRINAEGSVWWANLQPTEWFATLMQGLQFQGFTTPIILSSSGRFQWAPTGKVQWLRKQFGPRFQDYVFTRHKHLCAHPNRVLIDDSEEMVKRFNEHGGNGILFPQIWNSRWKEAGNPVQAALNSLADISGCQRFNVPVPTTFTPPRSAQHV